MSVKIICYLLFLLFFLGSCKKQKMDKCELQINKIDYHIAFVGFTAEELDTIFVGKYVANGNFDTLRSVDTLTGSSITFANDTSNTWFTGGYYNDLKINFASSKVEFFIKDPVYPTPIKYEAYGCGRSSVSPPISITVNDQLQSIPQLSINWGYLFLKKQ